MKPKVIKATPVYNSMLYILVSFLLFSTDYYICNSLYIVLSVAVMLLSFLPLKQKGFHILIVNKSDLYQYQ